MYEFWRLPSAPRFPRYTVACFNRWRGFFGLLAALVIQTKPAPAITNPILLTQDFELFFYGSRSSKLGGLLKKNNPMRSAHRVCEWCGSYWIRTSDFYPVKVTLWTNWVNDPWGRQIYKYYRAMLRLNRGVYAWVFAPLFLNNLNMY